ncbi:hypothetical protein SYNPS1DRAFT_29408 [Syncephalis pseudoplumigaleata]|uniref:Uncharacterized protein n=1 Tax=Syncephalis pseudoplumigaleata TaxID=1712513 RepID=A0A4P9YY57_9FUNG|nr:hypothetical protein SYNPS1DRAFT_29408 [Syncephalis pseudoplumigaleata]|eukprot:RKP24845.1 hypothetical protein SYNPS1DRAFT_29408 [Syncephalis pseudoplumigaleata]
MSNHEHEPAATAADAIVVYVTCPSETVAKEMARGLLQEHYAACVSILPSITSLYWWKEAIEEDTEWLLMIKTASARLSALTAYVKQHHPYDVPEVIALPIQGGNPAYLQWLQESARPPAVSIGGVPQLAVDLLITTLRLKRVGHLNDPNVLPVACVDPCAVGETGITTALEVLQSDDGKITVVQQRSPELPHLPAMCNVKASYCLLAWISPTVQICWNQGMYSIYIVAAAYGDDDDGAY